MICPKCNENNPESSLFCNKCGVSLITNTGTSNNAKSKRKKIIVSTVIGICIIGGGLVSYSYSKQHQQTSENVNTQVTSTQTENNVLKKEEDNKINGVDLGVLTKDDVQKIMDISKNYKGKSVHVEGKNKITLSPEEFRQTYGSSFLITTPYIMALDICLDLSKKYMNVNSENFIKNYEEWNKKNNADFTEIRCFANIGGDQMNFVKNLHMVLKVYGNEEKVIQPTKLNTNFSPDILSVDNKPKYFNSILAQFDAKEVQKLNPKQLEIIVIYPDGKEVKQKFDYNKLNDF